MKILTLLALLMLSTHGLAESVFCEDEAKVWQASFELEASEARKIEFRKNGKLTQDFGTKAVDILKINSPFSSKGIIFYGLVLGGSRYFEFERKFDGNSISKAFYASFLLKNSPFALEKEVYCTVE